jgi:hypothetical protein
MKLFPSSATAAIVITALVLLAIPFLPKALLQSRDGEKA